MRRVACGLMLMAAGAGVLPATATAAGPVRNVILFVGDGMGVASVTAARIHKGALEGLARPVEGKLALDGAPRGALVHTWSADNMVTDSAAGITAMATGHKVPSTALSVALREDGGLDTLTTLLEIAEARGMATGVVSTTRVTHATPAGLYAHDVDRGHEEAIAAALVPGKGNPRLGDGVEVVLGGGRANFLPKVVATGQEAGRRADGRDLLVEMEQAGYAVAGSEAEMESAVAAGASRLLGLFAPSHLTSFPEELPPEQRPPLLSEMTDAAIRTLSRHPNGFFLLVEGGKIDHALHDRNGEQVVKEVLEFDRAVERALALDPEETVILVTADHDHTMVIAGYAPATSDVLADAGKDKDGEPYAALLFATGGKVESAGKDPHDAKYHDRGGVPTEGETHGGMDVPLYFWGPAWLSNGIGASIDNTQVFTILERALRGE